MAEASDNLKAVMARHPEIKKLAEQKEAMRQALIAKGVDESSLDDFSKYADILGAFSFSIDSTIEANGFTHNAGTENEPVTLSTILAERLKACAELSNKEVYSANDFKEDTNIMYLTEKPLASDMSYFCYNACNLMYIPQLDFSNVKTISNIFSTKILCLLDEYTLDLASCAGFYYPKLNFTKKLIIKNMQNNCSFDALFYQNTTTESVIGINFSAGKLRTNVFFAGASRLSHIEQSEDSVIRCANVLSSRFAEPSSDSLFSQFDAETLYGFCSHAYDWTTNPREYTKVDGGYIDGAYATNYYNFRFNDAAKEKLESAYPDVDFKEMMEAKGWGY